ncbi:MAG: insulinase family protein [Candidatus Abyssobacteria bacterium SURF_5]|uniref:Insulinase family protein n=1 Tax=Abyssobacteria bacterium (strain SURF_5) TaxID=2093360 RepID=A0A3A4P127_ABYX5|nr:MAG: insulinase family protein [Candidatus Abyssubacteria bacterium SURF_5]
MRKDAFGIALLLLLQVLWISSAVAEDQEPRRVVLDNGMTVILLENHNSPVVTIQAWVRAGTVTEQEFIGSGVSHFVEHMLFKGTDRRSVGQLGEEVKAAGGQTNAYTGYDRTVYYITFHRDSFDKCLDILSDALMNSTFDPAEVEKEREVILKEIKMNRDDAFRRLYMRAQLTAYAVHPYGNPVIGYENLLRNLTRDDLVTYYKRLYIPNNITFIAVGDLDADDAFPKIEAAFADFQRKSISPITVPSEPPQEGGREYSEEFDVTVAQSMMGFHGPSLFSDDVYPMDVLAIILGGGDTSRLYRELREKQGIVYHIDAWSATPRDPGMFWVSSSFEPENAEKVRQAIWQQIEKVKAEQVTEEELETARAKVLSSYLFSRESVEGQARSLGTGEVEAHDLNYDKRYVDSVARVTAAEIQGVARKYFFEENMVVTALFPRGKGPAAEVVQREERHVPQIEKTVLSNGITLLLRDGPSTETVSIKSIFLGGALAETPETNGITNLMSKTMLKGTKTRSAEEIAAAIESRGGTMSSFSGHNSFGFDVSMLSSDVETGLAVLGDVVANPVFPEQEMQREKMAALANIKSVNDEIFSSSMKLFRETMFNGHPYSFLLQGDPEVIASLTPDDLRAFHTKAVNPSRMVLSIFGKIDEERVIDLVQEYFGSLGPVESPAPSAFPPDFPDVITRAQRELNKEQLSIVIGFPGVTVANPDRYPLDVLTALLNSQGGKLFQVLRDEQGLAYSVGAFNLVGVEPGAFVMYILTIPQKQDDAAAGMLDVIRDIKESGVQPQELERAKIELIGKHAIGLQTNSQIATEASFDELYGLGYDNYKTYDEKIRAVTAEDIQRVLSLVIDFDRYVMVRVGDVDMQGE